MISYILQKKLVVCTYTESIKVKLVKGVILRTRVYYVAAEFPNILENVDRKIFYLLRAYCFIKWRVMWTLFVLLKR